MSMVNASDRREGWVSWHLDWKFWLTLISTFAAQAVFLTWVVSSNVTKAEGKIAENTTNISVLQTWRDKQDEYRSQINAELAVMGEKLNEQSDLLHRIDERQEKFFSRGYTSQSSH